MLSDESRIETFHRPSANGHPGESRVFRRTNFATRKCPGNPRNLGILWRGTKARTVCRWLPIMARTTGFLKQLSAGATINMLDKFKDFSEDRWSPKKWNREINVAIMMATICGNPPTRFFCEEPNV